MNPQPTPPDELQKKRDNILKQFRAHLHLVITAHQTGQAKKLEALPGPNMMTYCRELAEWPGQPLVSELSAPVSAMFEQLDAVSARCEYILRRTDEKALAMQATAKKIQDQLDFALGVMLRRFRFIIRRAEQTDCPDLLCEVLCGMAVGVDAAHLVRRWQKISTEDSHNEDGSVVADSFPDKFAWDVYHRVEALDKLVDEFPDHIRTAARQMHGWPMLKHRHTKNDRRFSELAERLELGADYPTDASEGARFRPDTPMVRYLDPLIYRLHATCLELGDREFKSLREGQSWLYLTWWTREEDRPSEDVLAVLLAARLLPQLTKATAPQWAEKAVVPLILVTDARDYKNCAVLALQKIAKQKGVKSRAAFKSRLLAAVTATLRRFARPA